METDIRYSRRDLDILLEQERILCYDRFGSTEALTLGNAAAALAAEYDRGVGIQITRESDGLVLFQYMMDDKAPRNLGFMEGKRQATLACGHSSLYAFVAHTLDGSCQDVFDAMPRMLPCGGAFPLRAGGQYAATFAVSGLHDGKDHELLVRSLCRALGRQAPAFTAPAV